MKNRRFKSLFSLVFVGVAAWFAPNAEAAVTLVECPVSLVGWRDDLKALRIDCGGKMFFVREATANSTCGFKSSMDAIKMFQTTANASLMSGNLIQIYYEKQTGCNVVDSAPREIYLKNY